MRCLILVAALGCSEQGVRSYNAPPEAEITSHDSGSEVAADFLVELRGYVSDPDAHGDALNASWEVDGEQACAPALADAEGGSSCAIMLSAGPHDIRLLVRDPSGATASDGIELVAVANGVPTVDITAPLPGPRVYADDVLAFAAQVDDAESAPTELLVAWESSVTGALGLATAIDAEGLASATGSLAAGAHVLLATVSDPEGASSTDQVMLDVGPANSAPDCGITLPADNGSTLEGASVALEGWAADVDQPAGELVATWSSDRDGVLATQSPTAAGDLATVAAGLSLNTHQLTLEVTDERGLACVSTVVHTLGSPPQLTVHSPSDGAVFDEGAPVAFSATVGDGEDAAGDLAVQWSSDLAPDFSQQGADGTGQIDFTATDVPRGVHTLTVTVTDSDGFYAQDTRTFTVNGVPTAPTVSIAPAAPVSADGLQATVDADAVDPEGTTPTYRYAWLRNGSATGISAPTVDPAQTVRGDVWSVQVFGSDGRTEGPPGTASVAIGNEAPAVTQISLTPDPATTLDALTCAATAIDADADPVTLAYAWRVDGTPTGTSGAQLGAAWFDAGQVVRCTVTPSDGVDDGAPASTSLTIDNSAPSVTDVQIQPDPLRAADTAVATATTADPDGTPVTVTWAWTVDGSPAGSGPTLTGFTRAQVVRVTATPSDGTDSGAPVSTALIVANTPPTAPGVAIAPAAPEPSDNLLCSVSAAATDADADSIGYSVGWLRNGTAWTGPVTTTVHAGDTISAAHTSTNDSWTCRVVASDGFDPGPYGEAQVSITCVPSPWYADTDGDGYGDAGARTVTCPRPPDTVANGDDCDDGNPTAHPGADESCDGVDRDCDGLVNQPTALDASVWFFDSDRDGYGAPGTGTAACSDPGARWVAVSGDCDDGEGAVSPAATEWCDGIDNDCDGTVDEPQAADAPPWYRDADGDGFGDPAVSTPGCARPAGFVADETDCDDGDGTVYPFAGDLAGDGVDSDCDDLDCEAASNGTTYFAVCFHALDWHTSRLACLNRGYTDLASVRRAAEQGWIEGLLDAAGAMNSHAPWIGYADEVIEGLWGWSDLSTATYTNWRVGEPNGGVAESCAELNWPLGSGKWNDADCYDGVSARRSFVCELR